MGRIEEIQNRFVLSKGPWKYIRDEKDSCDEGCFIDAEEIMICHFGESRLYDDTPGEPPNAENIKFIESIHSDIEYLLSRLQIAEEALYKYSAMIVLDSEDHPHDVGMVAREALEQMQKLAPN